MSHLLELALINAILAMVLAVFAVAAERWSRRPALAHALWLLVLLKLLTPPVWTIGLPTIPLPRSMTSERMPGQAVSAQAVIPSPAAAPSTSTQASELAPVVVSPAKTPEPFEPKRAISWPAISTLVGSLWAMGSIVVAGIIVCRAWRFHRCLKLARPAPEAIVERVRQLSTGLELSRVPTVYVLPGPISPLVWALAGRARVLLPEELVQRLSSDQLDTLIVHELAHIRRRDHWMRWVEAAAMVLYWWHPIVLWARRRIEELEEECCDAWVVATLPQAAGTYAEALVTTVDYLSTAQPALPPAASGLGYVHFLKRRLNMILHERTNHRLTASTMIAIAALAMFALPFAPAILPETKAADDSVAAASSEDGAPDTRDLERRLNALEKRMDRILSALEKSGKVEKVETEKDKDKQKSDVSKQLEEATTRAREAKERAMTAAREARARARAAQERIRQAARDHDKAGTAEQLSEDLKKQATQLEKQIQESVHQAINPEKLKEMEREIQRSLQQNLSPERMEAMEKQIERAVNQAIRPERIEAMVREIERAVNKSLKDQEQDKARRDRSDREKAARGEGRGEGRGAGQRDDLERRMSKLEEKMDRLLQALESRRKD
jgi:beta-lactamase regulating signal transducer with metallopeptidase domain